MHIRLGPCGVTDSTYWDDGCHQRIESIFVSYDSSSSISSIQTVYKDFSNNIFIALPHVGPSAYEQTYSYHFEAVTINFIYLSVFFGDIVHKISDTMSDNFLLDFAICSP